MCMFVCVCVCVQSTPKSVKISEVFVRDQVAFYTCLAPTLNPNASDSLSLHAALTLNPKP